MKILTDNIPFSLRDQIDPLEQCLRAMNEALPLREVVLFGSHARGDARPDSDVDLCVISEHAERQMPASRRLSEGLLHVWPRPSFTLIPITPARLAEKRQAGDHFFKTVFEEGLLIATED